MGQRFVQLDRPHPTVPHDHPRVSQQAFRPALIHMLQRHDLLAWDVQQIVGRQDGSVKVPRGFVQPDPPHPHHAVVPVRLLDQPHHPLLTAALPDIGQHLLEAVAQLPRVASRVLLKKFNLALHSQITIDSDQSHSAQQQQNRELGGQLHRTYSA